MRKNYYYIAPIELWRGFMEEPDKILNDVLAFETAAYSTKEQAEEALGVSYGSWEETMREFGITLLITLSEKEKVITRKFVSL